MHFMIAFMIAIVGWVGCSTSKSKKPQPASTKKVKVSSVAPDDKESEDEEETEDEEEQEEETPVGEESDFPREASLELFKQEAHEYLKASCSGCHSPTSATRAPVYFAQDDAEAAHDEIIKNGKVNYSNLPSSRLVLRLTQDSHNCPGGDCAASGLKMTDVVNKWLGPLEYRPGEKPKVKTNSLKLTESAEGPAEVFEIRDFVKMANDAPTVGAQAVAVTDAVADEGITAAVRFNHNNNNQNPNCAAPNNANSRVTYTVNVEKAGKYVLYLRAKSGAANMRNSVCVQVNAGAGQTMLMEAAVTAYKWMPAQAAANGPLFEYDLPAGPNTFVFSGRGQAANNAATPQVAFNRIGLTSRINEVFRGVQAAPLKPQEVMFDLNPVIGKNAKIFMTVNEFDETRKIYGVGRLRLVTEQAIKIEGIDILVNGKRFDFNKIFRGVKIDAAQAGEYVERAFSVIQGENGFAVDDISLAFDKVE